MQMLQLAIEGESRFRIDEIELNRPPPSFTIDTVTELRSREDQLEISYLIGSDNLPRLDTWHRIDELHALVRFVVLERGCAPVNPAYLTIRRQIDISATEIRNRVATGRSIQYLVPPAVEEIIRQSQLYQEPTR
jgi:nicotinate-nucleotide adenylyltransferase